MARYVLQLGGLGFVRTKTLKAFPETAYREIIRSLGLVASGAHGAARSRRELSDVILRTRPRNRRRL